MPPKQRSSSKPKAKAGDVGGKEKEADPPSPEEPTQQQQQRQQRQRTRRGGVSWSPVLKKIGFFMLLILVPAFLNYAALNQETRMLLPNGTLYDIGWNQKLLLRCTGKGLPTVILDAPVGQTSDVWALVEPLVAKKTKVCAYDRAGLGFSDRAYQNTSLYSNDYGEAAMQRDRTQPYTVERMADDLHRLISYSSNQPKPVLLVGVDFSTFVSRFYTQLYEHEVAGLLLIDPTFEMLFSADGEPEKGEHSDSDSESQRPLTWHEYWYEHVIPGSQGVWLSAVVGFNRLSLMVGLTSPLEDPKLARVLSQEVQIRKKHLLCQPKHLSSVLNEYFHVNESMLQMKTVLKVKPFPDTLPITIATYENAEDKLVPELAKVWSAGQQQLLTTIHPDSRHVTLPGADYLTLYTHPQLVASTILHMVGSWRRDSKGNA